MPLATETEKIMPRNKFPINEMPLAYRSTSKLNLYWPLKGGIEQSTAGLVPEKLQSRGGTANFPRSGRRRICDDDFRRIEQAFHDNPRLSTRNTERALQIPLSTIRDVLKKVLKMFPYEISFLQQLFPNDYRQRLQWAQNCRREIRNDPNYLTRIVFSDECFFYTNGVVNKYNARIWGTENSETVIEVPQRSTKVMVWCAMHKTKLIGPYFFRQSSVDAAA